MRQRLIDQYHGSYNYPQLHEEEDGFTDPYSIFVYAIRSPHTKESYFDNIDFRPNITRTSNILPLSVVTGDKGYDSEDNHSLVRDGLHAFSIIPARYEHVPIWRTHGKYRKEMKLGYSKLLYNQRNKDETIISVIKRRFGEHLMSRLTRTQNRELSFRCIIEFFLVFIPGSIWFLDRYLKFLLLSYIPSAIAAFTLLFSEACHSNYRIQRYGMVYLTLYLVNA